MTRLVCPLKMEDVGKEYPDEEVRMPRFFPTVLEPCKVVAARFFHCFTTKSEMLHMKDQEAGLRAAMLCQDLKSEYTTCMEEALRKRQQPSSLSQ